VLGFAACQAPGTSTPPGADSDAVPPVSGERVDTLPPTADPAPDIAPPAAGEGTSALPPLTPDGWGPLRVGMTLEEVTVAAGADANPAAVGGPDPERCDEFRPERAPEGMLVMIERGRLTRISLVRESAVETAGGFGIGDSAEAIEAAAGTAATSEPHQYKPAPARYITIWRTAPPAADARGIRYDVGSDGLVDLVHAGGPSIEYVEGCL
ncbi:MAG TPA: hypothetical protein VHG09_01100, partial [Longimicrobiales bacterium]|nr:hypothetical protein [Longimicrobiales bacterium]